MTLFKKLSEAIFGKKKESPKPQEPQATEPAPKPQTSTDPICPFCGLRVEGWQERHKINGQVLHKKPCWKRVKSEATRKGFGAFK